MRVLIVGSGGREHALGWRLAHSPSVDAVGSAPGNPGLDDLGPCHDVQPNNPVEVARLAEKLEVDLVVVGPEAPLVAGVADELRRVGVPVFGPTAEAARIEGSKAFAKEVMQAAGVPTGAYGVFGSAPDAIEALDGYVPPYVIKADGLAAGKGVVIAETHAEAVAAIEDALVRNRYGDAGDRIVIEEYLEGPEVSVFGVCDGDDVLLLPPSQDFKRAHDDDQGPNTGGMGAYTPVPFFGVEDAAPLRDSVFCPVLHELERRGHPYVGLLYAGLVLTDDGPKVLEFNCRFGDPETQSVIWRVASDFGELLASAVDPTRGVINAPFEVSDDAYVTVVLASGGYPGTYEVGHEISGIEEVTERFPDVHVFHAGTRRDEDGRLVTAGGRVLNVTAQGSTVREARSRAYDAADMIGWEGVQRRDDIALEAAGAS